MKNEIIARVSVGLDGQTAEALNQALLVRYGERCRVPAIERGGFLRLAILAYSSAIVRMGKEYDTMMLACDVRPETPDEFAARMGKPRQQQLSLPDNIVPLFPADESAAAE